MVMPQDLRTKSRLSVRLHVLALTVIAVIAAVTFAQPTSRPTTQPEEFVRPPEAELAHIREAAIFAETANLAGLDWKSYYVTFMKLERRKDWTDKQIKYIGIYFGAVQGKFRKEHGDMKFTEEEVQALRTKLETETARLNKEATTRPYRKRSE